MPHSPIQNYLTIDVEDYYQVSAFEDVIRTDQWGSYESRVEKNTRLILELLTEYKIKATFFVVGWIAERHPDLVREIFTKGHEIGCHSYLHQKVYNLTPEEFREDTSKAKDILEQILGQPVFCYRAPSYSITRKSLWALDILKELGFQFDSSIFPIRHDIYGIPDAPRFPFVWDLSESPPRIINQSATGYGPLTGNRQLPDGNCLIEYPISTVRLLGKNIPSSGGGYFRLFPYWLSRRFLRKINNGEKQPFIFYLHPWEVDPEQPRIYNCKRFSRFRHYNNLDKTAGRLRRLLKEFNFGALEISPQAKT